MNLLEPRIAPEFDECCVTSGASQWRSRAPHSRDGWPCPRRTHLFSKAAVRCLEHRKGAFILDRASANAPRQAPALFRDAQQTTGASSLRRVRPMRHRHCPKLNCRDDYCFGTRLGDYRGEVLVMGASNSFGAESSIHGIHDQLSSVDPIELSSSPCRVTGHCSSAARSCRICSMFHLR
jgi:hypothetical protein